MRKIHFKYAEMENFKKITKLKRIEYENNGLFLISGPNGAGKSTNFQAIPACLFRKINTSDGILKLTDLVQENIGKDLYLKVGLDIIEDDKCTEYEIITTFNHRTEKDRIYINGVEKKFTSVLEQVKFIENNIIKFDVFYNIINFVQQASDTFLSQTDAGQKHVLDAILDFKFFNVLKEKVYKKLTDKKDSIESFSMQIDSMSKQIQEYKQLLKTKKEKLDSEELELVNKRIELLGIYDKDKLEKLENDFKKLNSDIAALYESKNNLENNMKQEQENTKNIYKLKLSNLEQQILQNENKKKELENTLTLQIQNLKSEAQAQFADFKSNLDSEISSKKQQIAEYDNKMQMEMGKIKDEYNVKTIDLKDKLSDLKNELDRKKSDLQSNYTAEKQKLQLQKNTIIQEIKNLQLQMDKLQKAMTIQGGQCPLCLQEIKQEHFPVLQQEMENITNTINNLSKKQDEIDKQIELLNLEFNDRVNELNDEYNNRAAEINEQQYALDNQHQKDIENIQNTFKDVKESISKQILDIQKSIDDQYQIVKENLDKDIKRLEIKYQKDIDSIQLVIDELEQKKTELNNELEQSISAISNKYDKQITKILQDIQEMETNQSNIQSKIQKLKEIEKEINDLSQKEEILKSEYEHWKQDIENKIATLEQEVTKINDKITDVNQEIQILEFWNEAFSSKGIKSYIISSITPFMNNELNNILTKLFGERFKIKINLTQTESGDLKIKPEVQNLYSGATGYKKQSGGEKRVVDYAVVLVLNKLYRYINETEINIMLLDEYFDALDEDNSMLILQLLKDISKEIGIYIISHNESWKSFQIFDKVISMSL